MTTADSNGKLHPLSFLVMGTLFAVCLLTSNILEIKVVQIDTITATAGLFVFPFSYILNDVITEVWGYRKSCIVIWLAFLANLLVVLLTQGAVLLPSPDWWSHDAEFNFVFKMVPKVLAASLITFLIGSFINSAVMSKMKTATNGRHFSLRAIVSTLFGEGVDTIIFIPVVFAGMMPVNELLKMMAVQFALKSAIEIVVLPFTILLVRKMKQIENTDQYDWNISYNPFVLKHRVKI